MEKPSYYAILPANVRYAETLTPNAKLLYAEITALAQKDGTCWASNKYFAKLYNVTPETVSRWVSVLVVNGFVLRQITYLKGTKQIDKRYLQLNQEGIDKIIKTPIDKIVKDNNTSINNTSINNISNRKNEFVSEVLTFDYEESILNGFSDYWTEPNKSNTKMKWELCSTWKTALRLKTWAANQKKWDKPKTKTMSKIDMQLNEYLKGKEYL